MPIKNLPHRGIAGRAAGGRIDGRREPGVETVGNPVRGVPRIGIGTGVGIETRAGPLGRRGGGMDPPRAATTRAALPAIGGSNPSTAIGDEDAIAIAIEASNGRVRSIMPVRPWRCGFCQTDRNSAPW